MDLRMLSLGNSVPKGPCSVFFEINYQVYRGLAHNVVFWQYSDLISHRHTKTHSTLRGQHTVMPLWINIYTTSYVLTAAMCITLNGQFTNIKNLLSTMSSLFKNYSLVAVMYLLVRFTKSKFFPWNTRNTDGTWKWCK